jgi:hypothetical protein
MSYDLEILDGNPEEAEDNLRPLDCRLAWHSLQELLVRERVESDHDELLWFLPTLTVSLYVGHADDTVPSMAAAIVRSIDASASLEQDAELRRDFGRIVVALQSLAETLGATLYDPQQEKLLPRSATEAYVDAMAADGFALLAPEAAPIRSFDEDEVLPAPAPFSLSLWLVLFVLAMIGMLGWWVMSGAPIPSSPASLSPLFPE